MLENFIPIKNDTMRVTMFITNPQPGTKVQCPNCYSHCLVEGRDNHRWIECSCGRTEWHETPVCVGAICNCPNKFCPTHGKTKQLKGV